ncbi:hypothetical protein A0H81_05204 [Grifola frondosa]|uniref:Uncharacterized protein n=1 Tax=Grifola frondosa TaxID=5627 RepID=A0A1C7MEI1_GRIFR|nr:hypothetical protein A0H81_05204 [Grifola frondosa]
MATRYGSFRFDPSDDADIIFRSSEASDLVPGSPIDRDDPALFDLHGPPYELPNLHMVSESGIFLCAARDRAAAHAWRRSGARGRS